MQLIQYKKYLFKPIKLEFYSDYCSINGILLNYKLKFKKYFIFNLTTNNTNNKYYLFIIKNYFRTFFSLILKIIDGVSFGYKASLKLKGKGLRLQLKKLNNIVQVYLKLGYSHKIFFKLPDNMWIYIYERRRSLILFSLNYCDLRNILLKIRSYYPVNLYKIRGFYEPTELIKQKKGNHV
jgi:ribosomal protein L6P/L9E